MRCLVLVAILLTLMTPVYGQERVTVRGKITYPDGKPAAGARISPYWRTEPNESGDASLSAYELATSNEKGEFNWDTTLYSKNPITLYALSKDGKHGEVTQFDPAKNEFIELVLQRLTPVTFELDYETRSDLPDQAYGFVLLGENMGSRVFSIEPPKGKSALLLPPGDYTIYLTGSYLSSTRKMVSVRPGVTSDIGKITLSLAALARLIGNSLPDLKPTVVRGLPSGYSFASSRGKWLILEFWGYWCGPCVVESIPTMMEFHSIAQKFKFPVEIVAVHNQVAKTIAQSDKETVDIRARYWHGRKLPFPEIVDADNLIVSTLGVRAFPTSLLIDPAGKVIGPIRRIKDLEKYFGAIPDKDFMAATLSIVPNWSFSSDQKLGQVLKSIGDSFGFDVIVDPQYEPKMSETVNLYELFGVKIRTLLGALLDTAELSFEVKGRAVILASKRGHLQETPAEKFSRSRIEKKLGQKGTFQYEGELKYLSLSIGKWTKDEGVVLDPVAVKRGQLDPKAKVVVSGSGVTLRKALTDALSSLGLRFEVRRESIYIVPNPR